LDFIWKNVLSLSDEQIKSFGEFGKCGPECGASCDLLGLTDEEEDEDDDDSDSWKKR
jgi:hypothetical protein